MEKLVKIYVSGRPVVLSDSIKVFGFHGPIKMSTQDIFTCLASGAKVIEISSYNNKDEIVLNFHNYNKKNFSSMIHDNVVKHEQPVTTPVKEVVENITEEVENSVEEDGIGTQAINDEKLVTQNPVGKAITEVLEQNNNSVSSSFNNNNNNYRKNNKNRH